MYLILAEKPSAMAGFAKAFGGNKGTFNNQAYKLVAAQGHLLKYVDPHKMVASQYADEFEDWSVANLPWNLSRLNWKKEPIRRKNNYTKKMESTRDLINHIKNESKSDGVDTIVIATDVDPSGEGDMIAWEIINAIGWRGRVLRMSFVDETPKALQKAFTSMTDVSNQNQHGDYVKALVRSRWDFASMQLTRIATSAARSAGYNVVVRKGRLKSVMVKMVADQLASIKAYKKTPYYEVQYKDDNGHVYKRRLVDEQVEIGQGFRFATKGEAERDRQKFTQSGVVKDGETLKKTAPGKLLDLAGLSGILSTKGFKPKEIMSTYQKMYEAKIVSYPRTEDKVISQGQFDEMLPLINQIAGVVGVDPRLLTHRTPRKTHVKDGGAHGANRPGLNVPSSLVSLKKYGPSAEAIYQTLAKNFLSMFGEDYEYRQIKGHVQAFPNFVTTVNIEVKAGFKQIFDTEKESKDADDDQDKMSIAELGSIADSFVNEGFNKKPAAPTIKWLTRQLERYNVGTGATRVGTISEVTNGKTALLSENRGKLTLTQIGEIAAVLLEDTYIGNVQVTENLFRNMEAVGKFKIDPEKVLNSVTELVAHDKQVMMANASKLKARVGAAKGKNKMAFEQKEKATGVFAPNGQEISFNREWSGHKFTDSEVEALLNGETIEFEATSKAGNPYIAKGKLEEQSFEGRNGLINYWGFALKLEPRKAAKDMTAAEANFKPEWSGHRFNAAEEAQLRAGQKITIEAKSRKTGKPFTVDVTFELTSFNGNDYWGIVPHFN